MPVSSSTFELKTNGFCDMHDITPQVERALTLSNIASGIVVVFVPGSTAGITTIEFEQGVMKDLCQAIERLAPQKMHYDHDARWGDGNGFAHVRASLLGPSLSVPFTNGDLLLGTWQQIIFIDFDNRSRSREIHIKIVGD